MGDLSKAIFAAIDTANALAVPPIQSDMVSGYTNFLKIAPKLKLAGGLTCAVGLMLVISYYSFTMSDVGYHWASHHDASPLMALSPLYIALFIAVFIIDLQIQQLALDPNFNTAQNWQSVWPQCSGVEIVSNSIKLKISYDQETNYYPSAVFMATLACVGLLAVVTTLGYLAALCFDARTREQSLNFYKALLGDSSSSSLDSHAASHDVHSMSNEVHVVQANSVQLVHSQDNQTKHPNHMNTADTGNNANIHKLPEAHIATSAAAGGAAQSGSHSHTPYVVSSTAPGTFTVGDTVYKIVDNSVTRADGRKVLPSEAKVILRAYAAQNSSHVHNQV